MVSMQVTNSALPYMRPPSWFCAPSLERAFGPWFPCPFVAQCWCPCVPSSVPCVQVPHAYCPNWCAASVPPSPLLYARTLRGVWVPRFSAAYVLLANHARVTDFSRLGIVVSMTLPRAHVTAPPFRSVPGFSTVWLVMLVLPQLPGLHCRLSCLHHGRVPLHLSGVTCPPC